jgi:putative endonuclease
VTRGRQAYGRHGEDLAARWYDANGYDVLDRNWRCREGEIDLVVRRDGELVFSEVKTRSSLAYGHPGEAVGWQKQQRIRRLARAWLAAHDVHSTELRFDVVAIVGSTVEVIEAAF